VADSTRLFAIMASDYMQDVFFPPLMQRLLKLAPRSSIQAILPDLGRLHQDLETGPVDLAVGFFTNLAPIPRSVGLFRDSLRCAVPQAKYGRRKARRPPDRGRRHQAARHDALDQDGRAGGQDEELIEANA
jgi:DNA-binding transcriptional LysR family regulator